MAPLLILGHGQGAIAGQGGFQDLRLPGLPAKGAAQADPPVWVRASQGGREPGHGRQGGGEGGGLELPGGIVAPGAVLRPGVAQDMQTPEGPAREQREREGPVLHGGPGGRWGQEQRQEGPTRQEGEGQRQPACRGHQGTSRVPPWAKGGRTSRGRGRSGRAARGHPWLGVRVRGRRGWGGDGRGRIRRGAGGCRRSWRQQQRQVARRQDLAIQRGQPVLRQALAQAGHRLGERGVGPQELREAGALALERRVRGHARKAVLFQDGELLVEGLHTRPDAVRHQAGQRQGHVAFGQAAVGQNGCRDGGRRPGACRTRRADGAPTRGWASGGVSTGVRVGMGVARVVSSIGWLLSGVRAPRQALAPG